MHEGSGLKFDETKALVEIIANHDEKHEAIDDKEASDDEEASEDDHDVIEATNHICISMEPMEIARPGAFTENRVLNIHRRLMTGLLGNPGEYRKEAAICCTRRF